jgi:hypothetical protein
VQAAAAVAAACVSPLTAAHGSGEPAVFVTVVLAVNVKYFRIF